MGDLEEMASVMFDRIVHAGLAPRDMAMVERTREAAARRSPRSRSPRSPTAA